jgi:hypothetical protein
MTVSERVTWETCPSCGRSAAVGWRDGRLVQIDCPSGCRPAAEDFGRRAPFLRSFRRPATRGATSAEAGN